MVKYFKRYLLLSTTFIGLPCLYSVSFNTKQIHGNLPPLTLSSWKKTRLPFSIACITAMGYGMAGGQRTNKDKVFFASTFISMILLGCFLTVVTSMITPGLIVKDLIKDNGIKKNIKTCEEIGLLPGDEDNEFLEKILNNRAFEWLLKKLD